MDAEASLSPPRRARWRLRFSLLTLVLFVLLLGSGMGLWFRWEPWAPVWNGVASNDVIGFSADRKRIVGRFGSCFAATGKSCGTRRWVPTAYVMAYSDAPNGPVVARSGAGIFEDDTRREEWEAIGNELVSFEVVDCPLSEVLATVQDLSGRACSLTPGVEAEGGRDVEITLKVSAIPAKGALEWIAKLADIEIDVRDGALVLAFYGEMRRRYAGQEQNVVIYDLATYRKSGVLTGHTAAVERIEFAPSGRHVLTAAKDGTWRVWCTETFRQLAIYHADSPPDHTEFAEDGRCFATSEGCLRELTTGRILISKDVRNFKVSLDGNYVGVDYVAVEGQDGELARLMNLRTGTMKKLPESVKWALAFSPDGRTFLAQGIGRAMLFESQTAREIATVPYVSPFVSSVSSPPCFSPDSTRVALRVGPKQCEIRAVPSGILLARIPCGTEPDDCAVFSPDGDQILVGIGNGLMAYARRRPEQWWGIAWLPEFWLTVLFAPAFAWSVRRDWRTLGRRAAL